MASWTSRELWTSLLELVAHVLGLEEQGSGYIPFGGDEREILGDLRMQLMVLRTRITLLDVWEGGWGIKEYLTHH